MFLILTVQSGEDKDLSVMTHVELRKLFPGKEVYDRSIFGES